MTTYTNNLYNVVNFHMRQCFIAKRNLSEGKPLDPLTQTTIDTINEHIVIFNQSNGNKHQQKPIDKNNGFCCQIFWQNYLKQHEDCLALHSQTAQQVIAQVLNDWNSFFKLLKAKAAGLTTQNSRLPHYKNKGSHHVAFLSNQQVRRHGQYIVLATKKKKLKIKSDIKVNTIKQIRVVPLILKYLKLKSSLKKNQVLFKIIH